jgi:hypothetical protein
MNCPRPSEASNSNVYHFISYQEKEWQKAWRRKANRKRQIWTKRLGFAVPI